MGLFNSEGREPATARLLRLRAATKSGVRQVGSLLVQMRHATTPVGRAEAARERGDSRFLIELAVDGRTMRTVEGIEAVGWHFESVDYVRSETATTTNHSDGSTDVHRTGTTTGVYLFSRPPGAQ